MTNILCDVLLSRWPVNVSDHTLHHPLNAFIHAVPVRNKQIVDVKRNMKQSVKLFKTNISLKAIQKHMKR